MSRVTIIVLIALVGGIGAVSAVWPDSEAPPKPAPFGGRASDQGYPWIVSWERVELPTVYVSATGGLEMMGPKFVRPTALATADFDEDGMPDLVSGYAGSVGGFLSIHRGNEGFLWPYKKPLARAPFWPEARVFDLPEPPDLLGAGDFDADGHADVIAAARGGRTLYWLRGDGRGGVHERHERELPGSVTALAVGEINRADGLMDIVVGITGPEGPRVLIFEGPSGALRHEPEEISLLEEATALALGPLDEHDESDLAIAAGHHLLVVHGRDRYSPSERRALRVDQQVLPFQIVALALGDFRAEGEHDMEIAVLGEDGALRVLARDPLLQTHGMSASWTMIADHPIEGFSTNISSRSSGRSLLLVRARVSSAPTDDVLVLDPESRRAHVLTSVASVVTSTQEFGEDSFSLSVRALPLAEGAIVAVLPMRLNADALTDLVVLREGAAEPEGLITIASLTFTVNTTGDNDDGSCDSPPIGDCSLREAILAANSNPGPDLIHFNIPGSGPHTILIFPAMNGPLPTITDAVTIDGYTQPGATPNSNPAPQGLNAQLKIVIRRSGGTASGLTISASNVVVRGVVINNFNQNGILITGSNVIIEGNFIGTDAGGTNDQGNTQDGIRISGANNRVGGILPAARNLISGNNSDGIEITGSGATGNLVQGNLIGTTASGSSGLANTSDGIQIFNGASNNTIGGTAAGAGNVIAFNGADGVFVHSGTGNRIQRNSIFSNGGLGIDLGANGVTSNDSGDPDGGANRLQNFPVLQSIVVSGSNTTILGSIDSATSNSTYPITIEFFSNSSCDPSGHGEGETFLGAISVSGPGSFIATFAVSLPLNSVVTATATDSAGNTSEFSACARVNGRIVISKTAQGGDGTFSYTVASGATVMASPSITTSSGSGSVTLLVTPGVYAVTEGTPPAGWDFVGVVCGDPDGGTTTSGATANIDVDPGETVTCTYTNRKRGRVVVQKSAVGGDETFSYTGGLGAFTITTSGGTGSQVFNNVVPGVYAVTEGAPPAGWDFVGVVCGDPDGGTTTSGATANVDVDAGETVTCTYTNRKRGRVVVQKSAVGGDGTFSYTGGLGAFTITTSGGTGSQVFDNVVPGVYAVTEGAPPAGWDFVGVVCGDPDGGTTTSGATANVDVDPGEEVRCTYMNRKRGRIAVRKITDPNPDPTDTRFAFTGAATGSIRNGEALSVDNLVPGTYRVTEVVPDQFELISISCDDGASPQPSFGDVSAATATFRLDPGEVVTCTFVNRLKRANLTAVAFVLRLETGGEVARQSVRTLAEGTRGVIVVDAIQDRVRVFLNSRDGTLRPGQVVSVGREPVAAVAGDLDGDGMTDVITADFQSRTLTILRGAGDGTFQRRRTLSLPAKPAALTAGDFDRDGRLDVVVAYVEEDEIQVFRGEGDFRFTPGRRISVGKRPVALAAADFNDDRILDVAVVASASDTVSIWLGRGDGTFVLGGDVVVGREPVAIAVGDFDGDGKVDLVTADFRASTLSVVSNEGTTEGGRRLRLRVTATVPTAEGPMAVVSGRFFDERMGIASAGSVAGQVWVHTRESTGRWSTWQRMNVQVAAIAMVTEDVDGDERLDLIVLDATGSVIQVWLNSEGEVFRRRQ
jgi:CSLREA domain-containing protein